MEDMAVMASHRVRLPIVLSLLSAAVLALGWAAPPAASAQMEVRTQLGWLRNGEFAAVMVAEAKGFFTEQGIRHRIMDGGPGKNPVPIVGAGQATFGITAGGNNVFQARLAKDPVDVVAIGTMLQKGPYSYITLGNPTDPDPKPKDIEGKTLGMQSDGEIFFKALAKKHGVDTSKVKVEVVQANAEPLLVGRVDFFTGWVTNQPYLIEQEIAKPDALPRLRGKTWKAMRYADWGIVSYSDVVFATGKTIRENPDLVRRYMRALGRAMQYILDHPEETVQMVASFPDQVEKADKLAWRWKIQNPLFTSEDTKKNGLLWMNPQVWDGMMTFYKEYEQIPRVVPADEMMTNGFNPGIKR
jgi:ABC-type nitrate/sulfonate/bicarbonate transport system substrate-binding protein